MKGEIYQGAVFFDLDGTLLDNKTDHVPESAKKALDELRKNHWLICLSTGRDMDTHYSRKYLSEVEPDAIIHLNGNKISVGDSMIFEHFMEPDLLKRILDYADQNGLCAGVSIGEYDYYTCPDLKTQADMMWNKSIRRNFRPVSDLFENEMPVMAINFAGIDTNDIKLKVENDFEELILFPFNKGTGADVVEKGFSKAEGVEKICTYFNIDISKTFAFGDSPNDLPMLRKANTGIAMGNASDELKIEADFVTDRVDDNGIRNALIHFGLI